MTITSSDTLYGCIYLLVEKGSKGLVNKPHKKKRLLRYFFFVSIYKQHYIGIRVEELKKKFKLGDKNNYNPNLKN